MVRISLLIQYIILCLQFGLRGCFIQMHYISYFSNIPESIDLWCWL